MEGGNSTGQVRSPAKREMTNAAQLILLAFLFLLRCGLDWIELKDDLEEMQENEDEEQREDDCDRAASEDKG